MAIKCLKCDYEMSTYQEVTTFISVLIPSIVNLARDILSLYHGSLSGAVGFCSGPLNQMKAKCPKCGNAECWEDVPKEEKAK